MLPRDDKKHHTQFPLYGGGVAQRRGGQRMQESIATSLSLRVKRSNPVNYARAYARLYYDWIATVALLPRDDKKHHTQFPSVGGGAAQRRGGQRIQESATPLSLLRFTRNDKYDKTHIINLYPYAGAWHYLA